MAVGVTWYATVDAKKQVAARFRDQALERAYLHLINVLTPMADRTRTYSTNRIKDARDDAKHLNLQSEAHREIQVVLPAYANRPVTESLRRFPEVFDEFAQRFEQTMHLTEGQQRVALASVFPPIQEYARKMAELLGEDYFNPAGGGTHRQVLPPVVPQAVPPAGPHP